MPPHCNYHRTNMHSFAWWPTFGVLVVAAFIDIWSRRIPNWLSLPFLVAGLGVSAVRGGLQGFQQSVAGVLLGAIVAGLLWYLRGLGMGDVKLLTAVGAWIGPSQLLFALVATGMAGGFLGVAYALWHRSLGRSLDTTADLLATLPK